MRFIHLFETWIRHLKLNVIVIIATADEFDLKRKKRLNYDVKTDGR